MLEMLGSYDKSKDRKVRNVKNECGKFVRNECGNECGEC